MTDTCKTHQQIQTISITVDILLDVFLETKKNYDSLQEKYQALEQANAELVLLNQELSRTNQELMDKLPKPLKLE